ncbi:MAG: hypothetical protein K1X83_03525 [Oligoflexia bacterium]|nr:hypothetical protein [Oligoflexia bacterium]
MSTIASPNIPAATNEDLALELGSLGRKILELHQHALSAGLGLDETAHQLASLIKNENCPKHVAQAGVDRRHRRIRIDAEPSAIHLLGRLLGSRELEGCFLGNHRCSFAVNLRSGTPHDQASQSRILDQLRMPRHR